MCGVLCVQGDIKEIANVKFVDYFSDKCELFVYDASRISQFLWCPCILMKYSHKFGRFQFLSYPIYQADFKLNFRDI